jgi:hypothetical protein
MVGFLETFTLYILPLLSFWKEEILILSMGGRILGEVDLGV